MRKIFISLLSVVLLLSAVSCNKTPPDVSDNTDKDNEKNSVEEQLLSSDRYDVFEDEIYLCDDVYRSDDTLTHGTGSIALPMGQDVLEVADFDILLCGDGCEPEAVVSRASQGYAPAYQVVSDGEIDGNFKVLKFKMEIPEPMLEDIKEQGVYEQITEQIESQYYYLLVLDEKHYAYIHLERIEGVEKVEHEAELADAIVKNARISFEPKNEKLDLTIERVIRLAENKGEALTWSDFEMYSGRDIGSGLFILLYEIDENFELRIGGVPTVEPMYVRLISKSDKTKYIDIRTEDVEKFISENRKEASQTEYPVTIYSELVEVDSMPKGLESAVNVGNTADGLSHFYQFQYGLEYYRYDSETDTYYKGVLTLPDGYNDGKIYTFRQTASGRGIEIIIKAVDESEDIVYLGYKFAAPIDPLNSQPSSRAVYDEEDFIGVNADFETEIVWENIDGEWYYNFADANGYQFYRLAFDTKTLTMNFDYGYYESEYVNRYTGNYTVDSTSQEIAAVLHDSSVVHSDPDIRLKFRLSHSENSRENILIWNVLSCNVEKYDSLVGNSVEFVKNMPSIIELSAVTDGEFRVYTIPQDGDSSLMIRVPKKWYWEDDYSFIEDYDGSSAYPTVKRVAFRKTTQNLQEFTDELRATEPGYTQYNMDNPFNGETDAGDSYVGYYGDGEQIKGLRHRRYLFYVSTDADAYVVEVWQYPDLDGEDFVDKILYPIVKSFDIRDNNV